METPPNYTEVVKENFEINSEIRADQCGEGVWVVVVGRSWLRTCEVEINPGTELRLSWEVGREDTALVW